MNWNTDGRRLRYNPLVRELAAETIIDRKKLIMPHFVVEQASAAADISSMPGIRRETIDQLLMTIDSDIQRGLDKIILFGIPAEKDASGSGAYDDNGIVQKACREIKRRFPELLLITDVCLCEYTDHGHCGLVADGRVVNDPSLVLLARTALSHSQAGADMVAPSDMMDRRVAAIRSLLDENGCVETPIMAYSAKYSSAFYGPFREAAGSAPQFGDRRSYQMDIRNAREAEVESLTDLDEGADIIMVKPALAYLDIISRLRPLVDKPLCAYNVSGEYSMVKAMAEKEWGDERALTLEILTSIFRAGADMVISYHARDIFKNGWL
jgi:porphobilinogen synthase